MAMTYARVFGLRYFGEVLVGPNAGRKLDNWHADLIDIRDEGPEGEAAAVARAREDLTGKFRGRVEVYAKQWHDRPGRKGGFVYQTLHTLEGR